MNLNYITKFDLINYGIYFGQVLLSLILLLYIILLIRSFSSSKVYQKTHPSKGNFFSFKPLSSLIYSIICFCFIFILIKNLKVLGQFAISYIDNTSTFIQSNEHPELEDIVLGIIIIIPSFLVLFSIIANFSRATFVIHEIDNGILFSKSGKKAHNYKEGFLRFLIISLFLLLEFYIKELSNSNVQQNPFEIEFASLLRFLSFTDSSFYESLFWIGILLFILYVLLLCWLSLNKSIFKSNIDTQLHKNFYKNGMIVSFFLILLGYSVNATYSIIFIVTFILGTFSIYYSYKMLRFIAIDIYSNFTKAE